MAPLRESLELATGSSRWVIAMEVDIRGFSRFSEARESVEAAYYLRRTFMRIIDDYFNFADFLKSTGDGLLLIFEHDEADLVDRIARILAAARKLIVDFPDLHQADPMINFPVPQALGIGLARGAATRLAAGDDTLDYAGRVLNLASRLCDLARPTGIVVGGLLPEIAGPEGSGFEEVRVYLRGIADEEAVPVYVIPGWTQIPDIHRRRPTPLQWVRTERTYTLREMQTGPATQAINLEGEPADSSQIQTSAHYWIGRGKSRSSRRLDVRDFQYLLRADKPIILLNTRTSAIILAAHGVRLSSRVSIRVEYPIEPPAREDPRTEPE